MGGRGGHLVHHICNGRVRQWWYGRERLIGGRGGHLVRHIRNGRVSLCRHTQFVLATPLSPSSFNSICFVIPYAGFVVVGSAPSS